MTHKLIYTHIYILYDTQINKFTQMHILYTYEHLHLYTDRYRCKIANKAIRYLYNYMCSSLTL